MGGRGARGHGGHGDTGGIGDTGTGAVHLRAARLAGRRGMGTGGGRGT